MLSASASAFAQHRVIDSRGEQVLDAVPQRVAALNWDIAEQVIELAVEPVGMPDIAGYEEWVVKPAVPESTQDIGTRVEPNFERLAQLEPDVIIIASPQLDLLPRLEKIAPVLYYHTYSDKHNNSQAAINNFTQIAQALDKQALAHQKLDDMETQLAAMSAQLDRAFPSGKPNVNAFRFASTTSVYLYGDNSTTQYVLEKLGFNPKIEKPASQWGVTQVRINELKNIEDGIGLYFKPFDQEAKLSRSVLWQALPFVRYGKVNSVEPVWNYGGAMSLLYTAQAVTDSLLEIAEQQNSTL
ncbi:iron-siderophore ABC transporter substrate-binding protein [Vibrio mexicanus]|uniref:iron-siderophore ABC transporter substrate-binding protein n=1 Tax=Vibrio mexicanus TaxID=1004326 RepID=UPI00063C39B9